MPNHVYFIAEDGLRRAIGEAHRRYTRQINFRENWRGHLWQGRFASYIMDEQYLLAAARYIELNPVRAKLTADPKKYPWSSAEAHIKGDDALVVVKPLLQIVADWRKFLADRISDEEYIILRRHERSGRPLGNNKFISRLEEKVGINIDASERW
jgi:putative transposase